MARKKKSKIVDASPVYYVYYDYLTGQLLSVTNEAHATHSHYITIEFDDYDKLVSGIYAFLDYKVDYIKEGVLGLVSVVNETMSFNNSNTRFLTITESKITNYDLLVEWHGPTKHWIFNLSEKCKGKLMLNYVPSKIEFFVILENDYDLLIRTIVLDTQQLFNETIYIPFENRYEHNISSISIATKSVFKTYRLDIINE